MCEAFGCTPEEAERQDWELVQRILEHRAAKLAVRLFNGSREDLERLGREPMLMNVLLEMQQAQTPGLTLDDVRRDVGRRTAQVAEAVRDGETFGIAR